MKNQWTVLYNTYKDEHKVIQLDAISDVYKFGVEFEIVLAIKTRKLNELIDLLIKVKDKK